MHAFIKPKRNTTRLPDETLLSKERKGKSIKNSLKIMR